MLNRSGLKPLKDITLARDVLFLSANSYDIHLHPSPGQNIYKLLTGFLGVKRIGSPNIIIYSKLGVFIKTELIIRRELKEIIAKLWLS